MEIFLELSRQCNMKCFHCLRGNAQKTLMPDHIIWRALYQFKPDYLGIGGGEPIMNISLLKNLRHQLLQAQCYPDDMWIVTNGITLSKEELYAEDEDTRKITNLLLDFPVETIYLAVSTDKFHEDLGRSDSDTPTRRFNEIEELFECSDKVSVSSHGANTDLLSMGRYSGGGLEEELNSEVNTLYIDVNGYVWVSCNLSYNFMDNEDNRNSVICLGNILKHNAEYIFKQLELYQEFFETLDDTVIYITESWDFEKYTIKELITEYNN